MYLWRIYSCVYYRINYKNRPRITRVIDNNKVPFLWKWNISTWLLPYSVSNVSHVLWKSFSVPVFILWSLSPLCCRHFWRSSSTYSSSWLRHCGCRSGERCTPATWRGSLVVLLVSLSHFSSAKYLVIDFYLLFMDKLILCTLYHLGKTYP